MAGKSKTKTPLALARQVLDIELEMALSKVMTVKPTTLRDSALAVEALKIFHTRKIDDLIVVNAKREPVGLIDTQDLPKLKLA